MRKLLPCLVAALALALLPQAVRADDSEKKSDDAKVAAAKDKPADTKVDRPGPARRGPHGPQARGPRPGGPPQMPNPERAFNAFDKDKSGQINAAELKEIIGGGLSEEDESIWASMIKEADMNGNGQIDADEFMKMMYTLKESSKYF